MRGEWNGDVDLDDGKLQLLRSEYLARINDVPKLNEPLSITRIELLISDVEKDLEKVDHRKLLT